MNVWKLKIHHTFLAEGVWSELEIQLSLNVQGFDSMWSLSLIRLFKHFVTGSEESEWDHMTGKLASSTFLLLHTSLSQHSQALSCINPYPAKVENMVSS